MSLVAPFSVTATVTPQARDQFGDRTPGDPVDVPGCVFWIASTDESSFGQDTVTWDATLLAPTGASVNATDLVTVAGVTYEVDGEPTAWSSPLTGRSPGTQVRLRAQTG